MKRKILISACLLGENCRYDGATKTNQSILDTFENDVIIPFCPEAPVLGTPRERISIVLIDKQYKLISDETQKDVTGLIIEQVDLAVKSHPNLDMIVLKSKSPSCGLGTTPILNEDRSILKYADGIAAARLKEKYPNTKIISELDL
ncbi:DUF523 domain-containing protein [Sulfurimonas sp. MAG313]|nr:DUF523 domain-containing protein [Sulfurimonas sp. MAG313]MDF1882140.1 DUF523 domain-containing protein [Sulfurimonas sp. MAG313]